MRRAVKRTDGTTAGTIGDECHAGRVVGPVLNPRDRFDNRPDTEVEAPLHINGLTLAQVKELQGRQVAVFVIEE